MSTISLRLDVIPASFVVWKTAGVTYGRNMLTGETIQNPDSAYIINQAIQALTSGLVFIKDGSYTITSEIQFKDGVFISGETRDGTQLICSGITWAFKTPDLATWRSVWIRNLLIYYAGIHFGSVNYGGLENIEFSGVAGDAIKTERTGGNLIIIRNIQVEDNYEANSVGIRVLSDWVHMKDIVISKTANGGVIVGSDTIKPYHTSIIDLHGFYVRGYLLDIYKVYRLMCLNAECEIPGVQDAQILGAVKNRSTDVDIQIIGLGVQPQPWATFLPYDDTFSTMHLSKGAYFARTENRGTATIPNLASGIGTLHGLALQPTIVISTGRHTETDEVVCSYRSAAGISLTVPAAVTADRIVDWYAEV